MANAETMLIEVAYALPSEQCVVTLEVPLGSTVQQAVERSRLAERFSDIDLTALKAGVFGKLKKTDHVLHAGDRVEIYRPLIADPKEVRKQRAAAGKTMKKGTAGSDDAA